MALVLAMAVSYIPFYLWVISEIREQLEEAKTHNKELRRAHENEAVITHKKKLLLIAGEESH